MYCDLRKRDLQASESPAVGEGPGAGTSLVPSESNCTELPADKVCERVQDWVATKVEAGKRLHVCAMHCKQWDCAYCGPRKAAWLKWNVARLVIEGAFPLSPRGPMDRMLTLTLQTRGYSAEESDRRIKRSWHVLQLAIERKYGPFSFLWVAERHQSGHTHLHVLVDRYLSQKWLARTWRRITRDSKIVHIKRMSAKQAARYVSKYLTKEARRRREAGEVADSRHLWGRSRDVWLTERPKEPGWRIREGSLQSFYELARELPGRLAVGISGRSFVYEPPEQIVYAVPQLLGEEWRC